ncbi:MAG: DVUA0089 family protein [candidate division KSB1 bacterium]|nr:DVUA0089 family protein [candidate division KSB1 bacterium]
MRGYSGFVCGLALCGLFLLASGAEAFIVSGSIIRLAGGSSVDYIYFTVNSYGRVTIDTKSWEKDSEDRFNGNGITDEFVDVNGDGEIAFFNTHIYLFVDDGFLDASDLIASNDNSTRTYGDGSISKNDAYLSRNLAPGNYILAIGAANFSLSEALSGFNSGSFYAVGENFTKIDHGDYEITITGDVTPGVIPEPTTFLLMGVGLSGWAFFRRLKKRV